MNAIPKSLDEVGRQFIARWESPDAEAFADMFGENGEYVDTAFGLLRRGRDFMRNHHRLWHRAISDLRITEERIITGATDIVVLAICEGIFDGESLGGGIVVATGKHFRARLCIVLAIDEHGKIARATDYYDRSLMPEGHRAPMRDLDAI